MVNIEMKKDGMELEKNILKFKMMNMNQCLMENIKMEKNGMEKLKNTQKIKIMKIY